MHARPGERADAGHDDRVLALAHVTAGRPVDRGVNPGVCRGNLNGFVAADADNADTAFSAWRGDRTNGIFHGKVHASG